MHVLDAPPGFLQEVTPIVLGPSSLLQSLAFELSIHLPMRASCHVEVPHPDLPSTPAPEVVASPASLRKIEAGPFRSLGGYFDYSGWDARDRFLELDAAIAREVTRTGSI
jgi:hypothetical protein